MTKRLCLCIYDDKRAELAAGSLESGLTQASLSLGHPVCSLPFCILLSCYLIVYRTLELVDSTGRIGSCGPNLVSSSSKIRDIDIDQRLFSRGKEDANQTNAHAAMPNAPLHYMSSEMARFTRYYYLSDDFLDTVASAICKAAPLATLILPGPVLVLSTWAVLLFFDVFANKLVRCALRGLRNI